MKLSLSWNETLSLTFKITKNALRIKEFRPAVIPQIHWLTVLMYCLNSFILAISLGSSSAVTGESLGARGSLNKSLVNRINGKVSS